MRQRTYLLPPVLPPVALSPVLQVPPELLPELSRVRGFELMSTDIASHRHGPHRFGMRRDASVLAYFLTDFPQPMSKAESSRNVLMFHKVC